MNKWLQESFSSTAGYRGRMSTCLEPCASHTNTCYKEGSWAPNRPSLCKTGRHPDYNTTTERKLKKNDVLTKVAMPKDAIVVCPKNWTRFSPKAPCHGKISTSTAPSGGLPPRKRSHWWPNETLGKAFAWKLEPFATLMPWYIAQSKITIRTSAAHGLRHTRPTPLRQSASSPAIDETAASSYRQRPLPYHHSWMR